MSKAWWSTDQAAHYLLSNYPCGALWVAWRMVEDKIEDGTFPTRYRNRETGECLPIQHHEWRRVPDGAFETLRVDGGNITPNVVEVDSKAVQRLCAAKASGPGGRPLKDWDTFHVEVIAIANTPDGLPDKQADLERRMLDWCQQHMADPPQETAVRDRVSAIYQRLKR